MPNFPSQEPGLGEEPLRRELVSRVVLSWDGVDNKSFSVPQTVGHHIVCFTTDEASITASNITVRAIPLGGSDYINIGAEAVLLTATGLAIALVGFFESVSVSASTGFDALVEVAIASSPGEESNPKTTVVFASHDGQTGRSKVLLGHEAYGAHQISLTPIDITGSGVYDIYGSPVGSRSFVFIKQLTITTVGALVRAAGAFDSFLVQPSVAITSGAIACVVTSSEVVGFSFGEFPVNAAASDLRVVKSADQPKKTDTTLALDDDLFVSLEANAVYGFTFMLFDDTDPAPDIKFAFQVPASATGAYRSQSSPGSSITLGTSTFLVSAGSPRIAGFHGTVITAGSAGIFGVEWAQNTSNAAETIVKKGAWLRVFRQLSQ